MNIDNIPIITTDNHRLGANLKKRFFAYCQVSVPGLNLKNNKKPDIKKKKSTHTLQCESPANQFGSSRILRP